MIKEVLIILILILAFPLGYLLAYLCRDELIDGRRYFLTLIVLSLFVSLIVAFIKTELRLTFILSLFYVAIVGFISLYLSYNRKFIKG